MLLNKLLLLKRKSIKIINTIIYKCIFFRYLKINPLKSYFNGSLTILKGQLFISNGLRNKKNLNISINGGLIKIGERVFFNNNVSINCQHEIIIGNDCLFGENISLYDHNHYFKGNGLIRRQGFDTMPIKIGNNVWIGSNSIILPGAIINDNVVIAAGSVVKNEVPENSLFVQKKESSIIGFIQ